MNVIACSALLEMTCPISRGPEVIVHTHEMPQLLAELSVVVEILIHQVVEIVFYLLHLAITQASSSIRSLQRCHGRFDGFSKLFTTDRRFLIFNLLELKGGSRSWNEKYKEEKKESRFHQRFHGDCPFKSRS